MRSIYSLLHFQHKLPKRLLLSLPDTVPDLNKQEGITISIVCEDHSQAFTLNTTEIDEVIFALSYARDMLQWRRLAALNLKYSKKGGHK